MTDTEIKRIAAICEVANIKDIGNLSDGYHTFNQLYYQRAVLFATIVNQNKDKSWKSFKHSDGKYCFDSNGEWFIVGIDTPVGSYTYHYEKKYWNMFNCQELECSKEWDGHTEEDVTRLLSLEQPNKAILEGKMADENIKEILACIIKHIRPDGDFYSFSRDEVEKMKNLLESDDSKKEREIKYTNNGCGFDEMSDYSLYLNG